MKFTSPELTRKDKLELLQRWIIVHSILYYEMSINLVSDQMFDANCRQLVSLMEKSKTSLVNTHYYYCMNDFDGTTGFDLYSRLNKKDKKYLTQIAGHISRTLKPLALKKEETEEQKYMRQVELAFKPTNHIRKADSCLWCKWGKLEGVKVLCQNPKSKHFEKLSKNPTRTTCPKWRYKF